MPALLELQRAFAASMLRGEDGAICSAIVEGEFTAAERLQIYRNACRSTLVETLRIAYPALERLVGREFFEMAAARFARAHPPRSAYLSEYGGELAVFLDGLAEARSVPYLADVARFEWALGVAANARHPRVSLLLLAYPADQIADAVLSGDEAAMAQIDLSSGPVRLVVHRGPRGVEAERLEPAAFELASRLLSDEIPD